MSGIWKMSASGVFRFPRRDKFVGSDGKLGGERGEAGEESSVALVVVTSLSYENCVS